MVGVAVTTAMTLMPSPPSTGSADDEGAARRDRCGSAGRERAASGPLDGPERRPSPGRSAPAGRRGPTRARPELGVVHDPAVEVGRVQRGPGHRDARVLGRTRRARHPHRVGADRERAAPDDQHPAPAVGLVRRGARRRVARTARPRRRDRCRRWPPRCSPRSRTAAGPAA